jgi:predicted dehydrogenase
MTNPKIRVGIIGLGGMAYAHELALKQLADVAELVAVCDVIEEKVQARQEKDGLRGYTRYQDLLQDPDVDSVLVTVPHVSNPDQPDPHYEIARAALNSGKHVLVEKPLALTAAGARELIDLAQSRGLKYTTAENTRFVTAYMEAAQQVAAGSLGEIYFVRAAIDGCEIETVRQRANWRFTHPQGGVILDIAIHSFYLLKWLFGGVRDISAFTHKAIPEGVPEDNAVMTGHLTNGTYYICTASTVAKVPWTERLEIYGSQGALIVDQLVEPAALVYSGDDAHLEKKAIESVAHEPRYWKFKSIVAEERDFLEAIRDNRPPTIDPEDGLYSVAMVEAAYESARTGRPVPVG